MIIKAVLRAAAVAGSRRVSKTQLTKLVYLTDVYHAELNDRQPLTDYEWRFLHYGPFAVELARDLDALGDDPDIAVEEWTSQDERHEGSLYSLRDPDRVASFRDLDLPGIIETRIAATLKRTRGNLNRLLNYVYFHTAPMEDAHPGDRLSFRACEKIDLDRYRTPAFKRLSKGSMARAAELMQDLRRRRQEREPLSHGDYDEAYYAALRKLEGEGLQGDFEGSARIVRDGE